MNRISLSFSLLSVLLISCGALAQEVDQTEKKASVLTIGSNAPALDIEHWVQDGKGHFSKVSDFESGKVYVVEFWATWCGPCISSMPHIVELQGKYAERDVQFVSVSREDLETVEKFLDREIPTSMKKAIDAEGENEIETFRDLTSSYCLTTDPDSSTSEDYMRAAGQSGIPCAFIVGKDAKIEWIGHPMSMDEPLQQVVSDEWDRSAFADRFESQQKAKRLQREIAMMVRAGKTTEAVALIDEQIESDPDSSFQLKGMKFSILLRDKDLASEATACAKEMFSDPSMDANLVNQIAWSIYMMDKAGRLNNDEVVGAALAASRKVVDGAGARKPYLLDTIAHLEYQLGNVEAALESQTAAIEAADASQKARLRPFLKELQDELNEEEDSEPAEEAEQDKDEE